MSGVGAGWRRWGIDAAAVVALGAAALSTRVGTLPFDGVWFDDSWVAAGAIHGRPTELLTVGSAHPAFTGLLMAVHHLGSGSLRELGVPSLVAGVLGPPVLYLVLRRIGTARAIALVLGTALAVASIHVLYSGRVKAYTIDTLLILVLVLGVVDLADRRWRWWTAVLWGLGAVVVGTFSVYALVASACATVVLALHPMRDRALRWIALVGQAAVQLAYLVAAQQKTDLDGINRTIANRNDGHLVFSWNPVRLVPELLTHLGRVGQVFPGGASGGWTVLGVVGVAGLVIGAAAGRRRRELLACQALLLMVLVAVVGAFAERLPFGPTNGSITAGGRHTLWLIPAVAVGLAVLAERVRHALVEVRPARIGFDVLATLAAVVIFVVGYQHAAPAPFPGSETAARFVDRELAPGDALIVSSSCSFAYADSTSRPVDLIATPDRVIGFAPTFPDPRIHEVGTWAVDPGDDDVRTWVSDADRVMVLSSGPVLEAGRAKMAEVRDVLRSEGFSPENHRFEWSTVQIWKRQP